MLHATPLMRQNLASRPPGNLGGESGHARKVAMTRELVHIFRANIFKEGVKEISVMEIYNSQSFLLRNRPSVITKTSVGLLLVLMACVGCGGGAAAAQKRLPVHAVTGTIQFNTQPVEGALVSLHPDDQTKPGGFGKTDAQGKFVIRTYADGPAGAPAGDYILTVQKTANEGTTEKKSGADMFKEMEQKAQSGQHWKDTPPTSLIPEKYAKTATSGIKVTVTDAGKTGELYDLKN